MSNKKWDIHKVIYSCEKCGKDVTLGLFRRIEIKFTYNLDNTQEYDLQLCNKCANYLEACIEDAINE